MKHKTMIMIVFVALIVLSGCSANGKSIQGVTDKVMIYKSATCGCCSVYADYLKNQGRLDVEIVNLDDVSRIKEEHSVPAMLQSCHTTVIGNYFIEGHIPLEAIQKLLTEKPDIAGIAMPGMPPGSPGMPGKKTGDFVIYGVKKDGTYTTFMTM